MITAAVWVFGVVLSLSPLLQIIKIIKLKRSEEVSILYYLVLSVSVFFWMLYGIQEQKLELIIPNCISTVLALTTISVILIYRRVEKDSLYE